MPALIRSHSRDAVHHTLLNAALLSFCCSRLRRMKNTTKRMMRESCRINTTTRSAVEPSLLSALDELASLLELPPLDPLDPGECDKSRTADDFTHPSFHPQRLRSWETRPPAQTANSSKAKSKYLQTDLRVRVEILREERVVGRAEVAQHLGNLAGCGRACSACAG